MQHKIGHYPFGLDGRCDVGEEVKCNAGEWSWKYLHDYGYTEFCDESGNAALTIGFKVDAALCNHVVTALNSHADFVELAQRVLILESDCECDPDADYGCLRCLAKSALAKAGEA